MATAMPAQNVTLILSEDEAKQLAQVLACVGGPVDGPRKHVDAVSKALRSVGFDFVDREHPNFPFEGRHSALMYRNDL